MYKYDGEKLDNLINEVQLKKLLPKKEAVEMCGFNYYMYHIRKKNGCTIKYLRSRIKIEEKLNKLKGFDTNIRL